MSLHDAAWLESVADLEERAQNIVRGALAFALGAKPPAPPAGAAPRSGLEISLVFTDDAEQRRLNRDYRHRDSATNVLSFANMDDSDKTGGDPGADFCPDAAGAPRLLGDVVLARETVLREAQEQGKAPADHIAHLLVHGLLHLLGYDHQDADEAESMESLETAILAEMGIADPYRQAHAGGLAHG